MEANGIHSNGNGQQVQANGVGHNSQATSSNTNDHRIAIHSPNAADAGNSGPKLPAFSPSRDHLRHTQHRIPLDHRHSFKLLGPSLFASVETQGKLCAAADLEPTLWKSPFPAAGYRRIMSIERTISLYLYCMDLALQRIQMSGSKYLMPDLNRIFAKMKEQVLQSLTQIKEGLMTYAEEAEDTALRHTKRRLLALKNRTHTSSAPVVGGRLDPDDTSTTAPTTLRARLRAQSLARQDDLFALTTSLSELEHRYKEWIDQRILAKRNEIREKMEEEIEHEEEVGVEDYNAADHDAKLLPSSDQPVNGGSNSTDGMKRALSLQVSDADENGVVDLLDTSADANRSAGNAGLPRSRSHSNSRPSDHRGALPRSRSHSTADPSVVVAGMGTTTQGDKAQMVYYPSVRQARDYGFLIPIPLDTPLTRVRRIQTHNSLFPHQSNAAGEQLQQGEVQEEMEPLELAPPAIGATGNGAPFTAGEGPLAAGVFPHLHAAPINVVHHSRSNSRAPKSDVAPHHRQPSHLHRLAHMDVTFTRSMDVLALNTFMFSTRGLIREILALSQAVRILLHMKHPGPFEAAF